MRELYEVWVHQCKEFRKLLTDTNYDELRNTLCSKCIHEIECSHAIEYYNEKIKILTEEV